MVFPFPIVTKKPYPHPQLPWKRCPTEIPWSRASPGTAAGRAALPRALTHRSLQARDTHTNPIPCQHRSQAPTVACILTSLWVTWLIPSLSWTACYPGPGRPRDACGPEAQKAGPLSACVEGGFQASVGCRRTVWTWFFCLVSQAPTHSYSWPAAARVPGVHGLCDSRKPCSVCGLSLCEPGGVHLASDSPFLWTQLGASEVKPISKNHQCEYVIYRTRE